jgi:hypothetical protein
LPAFRLGRLKTRSFPNGIAKVHFIFELANYFSTFFSKNKKNSAAPYPGKNKTD